MTDAIYAPRPFLPGDEVWFKVLFYESRLRGARIRYQQAYVLSTDVYTVSVLWHEAPYTKVRKVLKKEEVFRECPGEPLFSC